MEVQSKLGENLHFAQYETMALAPSRLSRASRLWFGEGVNNKLGQSRPIEEIQSPSTRKNQWKEEREKRRREIAIEAKTEKPFRFLDLPREIRDVVYCYLYSRSPSVLPIRRLKRKVVGGYQWADMRDKPLPDREGWVNVMWTTKTTPNQEFLIQNGLWQQPSISVPPIEASGELGELLSYAHRRYDGRIEIFNMQQQKISGFFGISLLRANKQINQEGSKALYGGNKFVFDTTDIHPLDAFEEFIHRIPGVAIIGKKARPDQIANAMNKLFDKQGPRRKFISKDPFLRFLNRIGPDNASELRFVKLEGSFKTGIPSRNYDFAFALRMGFHRVLSVHTLALKNACPKLQKLTLQNTVSTGYRWQKAILWDDLVERADKVDAEKLDEEVQKVVKCLPDLQELQLGECSSEEDPNWKPGVRRAQQDTWGFSVRWMDFDKRRALVESRKTDLGVGRRGGNVGTGVAPN